MATSYIFSLITFIVIFPTLFDVSSSVEINFSPSCSGFNCSLLSTFRPVPPPSANLTLVFSPGVHRMSSSTLSLLGHKFVELKPESTGNKTIILCTSTPLLFGSPTYNLAITYAAEVKISNLMFSGCNVQLSRVNKTVIQNTEFFNGSNGAIDFWNSYDIMIDESTFKNNRHSSYRGAVISISDGSLATIQNSIVTNHCCSILLQLSSVAGIKITGSNFTNNSVTSQVIGMTSCSSVTIDKSSFNKNTASSRDGIIMFSSTKGFKITRTNFTNNYVLSLSGIIMLSNSFGYIGCSNIYNNSVGSHSAVMRIQHASSVSLYNSTFDSNRAQSHGGIVISDSGSSVSVYNSKFDHNSVASYSGIVDISGDALIISSVFNNSNVGHHSGTINIRYGQPSVAIISSKFFRNSAILSISPSKYSGSNDVTIYCSVFVNAPIPTGYLSNNEGLCTKYGPYNPTNCAHTECNCK